MLSSDVRAPRAICLSGHLGLRFCARSGCRSGRNCPRRGVILPEIARLFVGDVAMLRGGPTDPTGSEGKEHGGHDKLATAAGGVFVLVWIGKDLRFASAGRTARLVSLVPKGMLIFTRPLTAQPLASSSGPSVRWRSLSQAMSIEGPEMAAMRPRGHKGELKRRKPGQAGCDGSESSGDGTKGDVEGGDGADINFFAAPTGALSTLAVLVAASASLLLASA
jgi:hypothetical protein